MSEDTGEIQKPAKEKIIPLAPKIEEQSKKEAEELFRKLIETAISKRSQPPLPSPKIIPFSGSKKPPR